MSSSPWGKIQQIEPVNLQDIMSEEIAWDMQEKENRLYMESLSQTHCQNDSTQPECSSENNEYCESDEVIAHMLQKQFDKEYDEILQRSEDNYNRDSKVSISYRNYKRSESAVDSDESDDELVDVIDRKDWDRFESVERSLSAMPRCGYMKQDGNIVTKHDTMLSGRKNTCKMMSFPPGIQTGDGAGFDLQLPNKVFNSLRAHSRHEQTRRHRIQDKKEDRATAELGVDEFTALILYKMINNGLLERINGVISTGKEAVIIHAETDPNYAEPVPKECVLKVFKTTLSIFKQRDKYIKDDYRFKDRFTKQNSRKMVTLWAEKEMNNLMRLSKAGVPCPNVVSLKKHVLVMSFIGDAHRPAPKLKDVTLNEADTIIAYEQIVDVMKKLYTDAKLVHADLSEYNILWYDGKCWFIDVGQSVEPSHPNAHLFLYRDCSNVSTFFTKKGVSNVKKPEELFFDIAGYEYHSEYPSTSSKDNQKLKPHLVDHPHVDKADSFEYDWEKSQTEHLTDITAKTNNLILVDRPAS